MVNKAILLGHVGQDPQVKKTETTTIANFSLATSESHKDKNSGEWITKTEWHRITVFGKSAEFVENKVKKGLRLYIEGKIQTTEYTDKEGVKRYTTSIVAEKIRVADNIESSEQSQQDYQTVYGQPISKQSEPPQDDENDLPF